MGAPEKQRRWLLLALGALLLGLVVLWSSRPSAVAPDGRSSPPEPPTPRSPAELAALAREPERSAVAPALSLVAEEPELAVATSEPEREVLEIEGLLIVHDEHDRELTDLDGSFLLTADDERDGRTIEVRNGRWRTSVAPGIEHRVENVLAGGRPAVSELDRQPRQRADGGWEVLVRWARPTVLVVRGTDTGLDLSEVEVAEDVSAISGSGCHPGEPTDEHWIVRGARSPITIPLQDDTGTWPGVRTLHVRAPGYAWGCIRVPETLGGEFALALEPGGTLEISITGHDERLGDARLRLRRAEQPDEDPLLEQALAGRSALRIDGLAAGRWLATIELGHRWRWPQVLARGETDLAPLGLARIELVLEPIAAVVLAPLAGRVTASRAWGFRELRLALELLDEAPRGAGWAWKSVPLGEASAGAGPDAGDAPRANSDEARAVWEWSIEGGVQPGRWSIDVPTVGIGLALDVLQSGLTDVELAIPDPVDITVTTIDAASGLPVLDAKVAWMPPRTWSDVGGQLIDAEPIGPGRSRMRVPRGPLELWCFPQRHRFVHELIDAGSPVLDHTLSLEPACGFRLRLHDGTTLVPWPLSFGDAVTVEQIGGGGRGWIEEQDANRIETRFVVGEPGRYRLELPAIPGYAPIPVQEVSVPDVGYVRHDVDLLRR